MQKWYLTPENNVRDGCTFKSSSRNKLMEIPFPINSLCFQNEFLEEEYLNLIILADKEAKTWSYKADLFISTNNLTLRVQNNFYYFDEKFLYTSYPVTIPITNPDLYCQTQIADINEQFNFEITKEMLNNAVSDINNMRITALQDEIDSLTRIQENIE